MFTSNGTLGIATVAFTADGKEATFDINVVHPLTVKFSAGETVLPFGETMDIEVEMYATDDELLSAVYFTPEDLNWRVSDKAAGTMNVTAEAVKFTAAGESDGKDGVEIYVAYWE